MKPVILTALTDPDPDSGEPMPVQIYRDLLAAIREGRLADGTKLPSSRAAAQALGVSRTTTTAAYELMGAEGVLITRRGAAPRITAPKHPDAPRTSSAPSISKRGKVLAENPRKASYMAQHGFMSPGVPDEALFPHNEWATALRRSSRKRFGGLSAYDIPYGLPELRQILAERLTADRGLHAEAERILITTGTQASLALLAQVMTEPGDIAAMEDPGYLGARAAFQGAGLKIAHIPMDHEGMRPDVIPDAARLIYVTPSNQYPLGGRMSLQRRTVLLEHARQNKSLILEDDYDSEFLWHGREIAALAAYGHGEVAYLGSAAKVLMPALRIGWLLLPEDLVDPMRSAQRNLGMMANLHAQAALADMMRTGRYRTHLRRISRAYEERGNALATALTELPGVDVKRPDGGVQLALRFHNPQNEEAILLELAKKGFRPARLSAYSSTGQTGLIIGFADATPQRIAGFCKTLSAAMNG